MASPERIYFDRHQDTIKPITFLSLEEQARILKATPAITRIRVEGHADSSERNGLDLSSHRAASAMVYLIEHGVERERLVMVGFGSSCPSRPNDTPDNRAVNRRVDFVVLEQRGKELETPACRDSESEKGLRFKAPANTAQSVVPPTR